MTERATAELDPKTVELVRTIAAEMRKPTEVEQQKLDADAAFKAETLKERRENSKNVKAQMENRRRMQASCSHQHADGHTHLIHVPDNDKKLRGGPGYLLCQWCNVKIRPENDTVKQLDVGAVYDTSLFNRLYQTIPNKEIFG